MYICSFKLNKMIKKIFLFLAFFAFAFMTYAQNAKKYTTYIVKEGESLRQIARKVGCKKKDIKNLNPDISKKPEANTVLVVPNKNYGKEIEKKEPKTVKTDPEEKIFHKVKDRDTFYGIAKKYNVPIMAIKEANPEIVDGLQAGQRLRIPSEADITVKYKKYKLHYYKIMKGDTKWSVANRHHITVSELNRINSNHHTELKEGENILVPEIQAPKTNDKTPDTKSDIEIENPSDLYIYHRVKQGEGLFRIAVTYDTTQEEIIKLNPEATKKLRPGMLLKIPGKKKDKFLIHRIESGDTFYSLTRRYNVSEEQLYVLNNDLQEGLKVGMDLKIRTLDGLNTSESDSNMLTDSISAGKHIHLSYLLPLMANDTTQVLSKRDKKLQNISASYYMGAELAINELKSQGLNIEHHVYDTKNNLSKIYSISKDSKFQESDAILGPFFFDKMLDLAESNSEKVFFTPIYSKKQKNDHHTNIVKTAVNKHARIEFLVKHLVSKYTNEKVIIIPDTLATNIAIAKKIGELLKKDSIKNLQYIYASRNKKDNTKVYMKKETLEESVAPKKSTWVILISDTSIINSDVVNTYGVSALHNDLQLFTLNTFDDFGYLDFNHLSALNWCFTATEFTAFDSKENRAFVRSFSKKNHIFPDKYAYKGYDLTYDVLMRISSKGNLKSGLNGGVSTRLAHRYNYQATVYGDLVNTGMMMVSFNKEMEFEVTK